LNLENELFSELKALLVQIDVSSLTYEQLIIKCQQLNSQYCVIIQNTFKSKATTHSTSVTFTVLAYSVKYVTSSTDLEASTLSLKNFMNLSIINMKKRGSLTLKKHQHRMVNHLCLYCEKPGHQAATCSSKPKVQPRTAFLFVSETSIDNVFDTSSAQEKA